MCSSTVPIWTVCPCARTTDRPHRTGAGSEGSGVSQLVKKLCDGVVRLDMAAQGTGVDSFNVSVAAGIILYEIQSQRAAE